MYFINFACRECGVFVKVLMEKNELTFSIIGKLHSEKECLKNGYYRCIDCKTVNKNIKFEKIYS